MSVNYLKKALKTSTSDASDISNIVKDILNEIEENGEEAALKYAAKFDKYNGNIALTESEVDAACASVPEILKRDIEFAHANVQKFAQVQKSTMKDINCEVVTGLTAGQKCIPVNAAGCYVPGG